MKAAVLVKNGTGEEAFEIREVDQPIVTSGQVKIKVECFGLNFADVMARRGLYKPAPDIPAILGYEVVGEIIDIGEGVDEQWTGKRVVAFTRFGGYAEYAVTPLEACAEINDMDAGEAAAIAVQYATAYYMACDAIRLHPGDKVMIHAGAGGVGTALIQLCKLQGCEVFANAGSDEKLAYMKEQGADHVMNYREKDYAEEIPKITNGLKLQATFNPIAGKTFKKDKELIGPGGKIMLFGGSDRLGRKWGIFSTIGFVWRMGILLPIMLVAYSKSIVGTNMLKIGDRQPHVLNRCMNEVVRLVNEGKIKPHVGARFKHLDIGKAHDLLESRKSVGKVVVYWE
ncbi:MAG: zinc-binding dehydrogenase [Crocinitomicaceae bacterium]|nr:zinc-binding dehydrogenase [Crocinitomicaceae bacterium]